MKKYKATTIKITRYIIIIYKRLVVDIKVILYSIYILMWPAVSLAVLAYILRAVWRDFKEAKKFNKGIL